jgi:hypothetical protein
MALWPMMEQLGEKIWLGMTVNRWETGFLMPKPIPVKEKGRNHWRLSP